MRLSHNPIPRLPYNSCLIHTSHPFRRTPSRSLNLIIPRHSLLIRRRRLLTTTRLSLRRLRGNTLLLLARRKLCIRRTAAVHRSIPPLRVPTLVWCVCRLRLHVVVGYGAALGVALRELGVGGVRRDGDDVPGVEEAGEEAKTWEDGLGGVWVIVWKWCWTYSKGRC